MGNGLLSLLCTEGDGRRKKGIRRRILGEGEKGAF